MKMLALSLSCFYNAKTAKIKKTEKAITQAEYLEQNSFTNMVAIIDVDAL